MAARRVLVIEDDAGSRDALGSLLSDEGYTVRTASSAQGGLACAREFEPDTVLCDFYLPDLDGLQVLRRLRSMRPETRVIILTADCGSGEVERALRREADLYMEKPLDLARLTRVLRNGDVGSQSGRANALN
jgi:DNA-binding response OmpR family regulator